MTTMSDATALRPAADSPDPQHGAAAIVVLCGLAATLVYGRFSEGVHHFDDLTHFLIARWAWTWPAWLLDDWGRPGFTALYFLPAKLGWPAARAFSALLSAATAWLAFRIAERMGARHAWLVPLFTYAQPLYFTLALTTLTETALAFYLTAALYLAQRDRWSASAALLSLSFVTRHEAVVFALVWIVVAGRQRVPLQRLAPLLWAVIVVNALAPLAGVRPSMLRWLDPQPSTQYGSSGWLTFFSRSMEAWGPALSALGFAGMGATFRRPAGVLVAGSIGVYFAAQTAIRALGLYDSGGYPRFLVPISPLIAISAAFAWERLRSSDPDRRAMLRNVALCFALLWIAMEVQLRRPETPAHLPDIHHAKWLVRISVALVVALALPGAALRERWTRRMAALVSTACAALAIISWAALAQVLPLMPGERVVIDALDWLRAHGYADRPIVSAHVYVDFLTDQTPPPGRPSVAQRARLAPPGAIIVWDRQFAPVPGHHLTLEDLRNNPAFRELFAGRPLPFQTEPQIRLFEKLAPTSAPAPGPE